MRVFSVAAVAAVVLGSALACLACSSFAEESATPQVGAVDAGSDVDRDATGGSRSDGEAGGACAALFCTGFDGDPFDGEWDGYESGPQHEIVIGLEPIEEAPRSARRALRVTVPATPSLYQSSYLRKRVVGLPAGARSLTYRFAVRLTAPNTLAGTVRIAGLSWGTDPATKKEIWARAHLEQDMLEMGVDVDSITVQSTSARRLVAGRWYEMATTLTFDSPTSATMESFVDGVSYDKSSFKPPALPAAEAELFLGAGYATSTWTPTVIDLDDVSFDAK